MWLGAISLFPHLFDYLSTGVTGRAIQQGIISLHTWNPRDFTTDKHHTVDSKPYGGGVGMLMMAAPLCAAIHAAKQAAPAGTKVIYLSPQGQTFSQAAAENFASLPGLIFVAGRYEGIDESVLKLIDAEWSIGDYILSGGEAAALVMMDAITRCIPGVVGTTASVLEDTHSNGLLKYPQYTRPEDYEGDKVPEILLSGHHQAIARWRLKMSLGKTWRQRPDLLAKKSLSPLEIALLDEYIQELA